MSYRHGKGRAHIHTLSFRHGIGKAHINKLSYRQELGREQRSIRAFVLWEITDAPQREQTVN